MNKWEVLGLSGDPTPGDPDVVRALADRLLGRAEAAAQDTDRLREISASRDALRMRGRFAGPFRILLANLPVTSTNLGTAYRDCGLALAGYAHSLAEAKLQAEQAWTLGEQADQRYREALHRYLSALGQHHVASMLPASSPGQVWRGLDQDWAYRQTQGVEPQLRTYLVQVAAVAGAAEGERRRAEMMARNAAEARQRAERRCVVAIRQATLEKPVVGVRRLRWRTDYLRLFLSNKHQDRTVVAGAYRGKDGTRRDFEAISGEDRVLAPANLDFIGVPDPERRSFDDVRIQGRRISPTRQAQANPLARPYDAEARLFEAVDDFLTPGAEGTLRIWINHPKGEGPCPSCWSTIRQFREKYPGVRIEARWPDGGRLTIPVR